MEKIIIPIKGMHCKSCEIFIEEEIKLISEVKRVEANHVTGRAKVWYLGKKPTESDLNAAIEKAGYTPGQDSKHWFSHNRRDYDYLIGASMIVLVLYMFTKMPGLSNIATGIDQRSIATAVVIGLIAGVSSCMALVGGLILALSARHAEIHPEATRMQNFRPHLFFNLGRIVGFAFLGGLIGIIGGALQPSIRMMSILTLLVGAVMILLGLKLIEIFPLLQKINFTLPKFIARAFGIKKEKKEYSHRGAFIGGVLTFFLPCGFTQAMQLFAISTGSFVQGALIMSLFALGTTPGLLGVGGISSAVKGHKARLFFSTAGLAVILLGIFNISNASRIVFPVSNATVSQSGFMSEKTQELLTTYRSGIDITPNKFTAKVGQPIKFLVDVKDQGSGCMSTIMIPGLYNQALFLEQGTKLVMEFTPSKKGSYPITCAMGVKRGVLNIE